MFKSIEKEAVAEIVEKKSKFIATIFPINSKEEAENRISEIKKKYYDAKHNCYAYVVGNVEKCSDDGEPSGTAGAPLLELLKNKELTNVVVIVTRYFGGILLGTGGLVRAYTETAKKAIESTSIVIKEYGIRYSVEINYNSLKYLQHLCKMLEINIVKIDYKINVNVTMESNLDKKQSLLQSNIKILNVKVENNNIIINK